VTSDDDELLFRSDGGASGRGLTASSTGRRPVGDVSPSIKTFFILKQDYSSIRFSLTSHNSRCKNVKWSIMW